mmetsp:Transcript_5258/g.9068  ORF Transcript_5258/g.9068 Transcript_5258/m.9068 type:complete len:257 (+) Transcript_5258:126-896(+)
MHFVFFGDPCTLRRDSVLREVLSAGRAGNRTRESCSRDYQGRRPKVGVTACTERVLDHRRPSRHLLRRRGRICDESDQTDVFSMSSSSRPRVRDIRPLRPSSRTPSLGSLCIRRRRCWRKVSRPRLRHTQPSPQHYRGCRRRAADCREQAQVLNSINRCGIALVARVQRCSSLTQPLHALPLPCALHEFPLCNTPCLVLPTLFTRNSGQGYRLPHYTPRRCPRQRHSAAQIPEHVVCAGTAVMPSTSVPLSRCKGS